MNKRRFLYYVVFVSAIIGLFLWWGNHQPAQNKQLTNEKTGKKIGSVIVPHHNLVKDKRVAIFKEISEGVHPGTIIIASPNHFGQPTSVLTSQDDWSLSAGKLLADEAKIKLIIDQKLAVNDSTVLKREHGITNLLGEIESHFPKVKIIPLAIGESVTADKIKDLEKGLQKICPNCLLINSVDFSHYQPGSLAEIHDSLSIRALNNLDEDLLWQAEVDSRQSLLLGMLWAKDQKTEKFILKENTNSGKIAKTRDTETTSYVFGWYTNGKKTLINDELTFMVGGDMMFCRNIYYHFQGDNLKNVMSRIGERVFWGTDVALVNLEGPISKTPIKPDNSSTMSFNFPPQTIDVLKWMHINMVSLANNHTGNRLKAGLETTHQLLDANGIRFAGLPDGLGESTVSRFESGKTALSIIAIDDFWSQPDLSDLIKQEKSRGAKVLIFPHWGTEYQPKHSSAQEKLASSWIEAGADMVIGGHPHVVQDAQLIRGKPVFYSLGNFLFDQDFSKETQRGLLIAGSLKGNKLKLVLLPTVSKNYQPELLRGSEKTKSINNLRMGLGLDSLTGEYGSDTLDLEL